MRYEIALDSLPTEAQARYSAEKDGADVIGTDGAIAPTAAEQPRADITAYLSTTTGAQREEVDYKLSVVTEYGSQHNAF